MGKLIRKKKAKRKAKVTSSSKQKKTIQFNRIRGNLLAYKIPEKVSPTKVEFGELNHSLPEIWDVELQAKRPMTYKDLKIFFSSPRFAKYNEKTFNSGVHSEETEYLSTLKWLKDDVEAFFKEVTSPNLFEFHGVRILNVDNGGEKIDPNVPLHYSGYQKFFANNESPSVGEQDNNLYKKGESIMSNTLGVVIITAAGELDVQIGRPIRRRVCTDMPRTQWWVIEAITATELELRQLVQATDCSGVIFSSADLNDAIGFSGTVLGSDTMSIPHDRIGAQDLDGLGAFDVWDIDIDSFDIDLETEVIETFQRLL